jgi:predicted nucleic acid-binding protein
MCELLLDTDVLIKLAAYGLLDAIGHPGCEVSCEQMAGLVGAAKYSARKALRRRAADPEAASSRLEAFILGAQVLEPTDEEILLAVELEESAAISGGSLDVGESQLCAIAISRGQPVVLTGDKRAVAAAERLVGAIDQMSGLTEKIACLEQAMVLVTERLGASAVRSAVVAAPKTDTALSICFQVTNPEVGVDFYPHGLRSYIEDLRTAAPTVLLSGEKLTVA